MPVHFFSEDIQFEITGKEERSRWIERVVQEEGLSAGDLNYIFCSDDYLLAINRQSLQHDFYTDIITFNSSEDASVISGDLFISIERVRENASSLSESFKNELDRVMIHGILHLCGYGDSTEKSKAEIRKKEDVCLSLRSV